jgi:hypothetical protein
MDSRFRRSLRYAELPHLRLDPCFPFGRSLLALLQVRQLAAASESWMMPIAAPTLRRAPLDGGMSTRALSAAPDAHGGRKFAVEDAIDVRAVSHETSECRRRV